SPSRKGSPWIRRRTPLPPAVVPFSATIPRKNSLDAAASPGHRLYATLSTLSVVASATLTTASKFGSGGSSGDRFTIASADSTHASSILSFAAVVLFSALFPALLLTLSLTSPSSGSVAL
ncbi:hypothetical protein PIB30_082746, partial [Stylosanthes scabra]|nr:hypothetical protein [Stylosanthes scabra]